jgi:hypothetical protein
MVQQDYNVLRSVSLYFLRSARLSKITDIWEWGVPESLSILLIALKDVLKCYRRPWQRLGIEISKQFDGHGWSRQKKGDQDCSEVTDHSCRQNAVSITAWLLPTRLG